MKYLPKYLAETKKKDLSDSEDELKNDNSTVDRDHHNEVPVTKQVFPLAMKGMVDKWKTKSVSLRHDELIHAKKTLIAEKYEYEKNRWKVMPSTCCGFIIGIIIFVAAPQITSRISTTLLSRSALDTASKDLFGSKKIS